MCCGGNGDRIARHNAIRNVLFSAAQYAALAPTKEAPSLVPGSLSRPADILLPQWSHGRPAALDVSVISPLQHLTLTGAASAPGYALRVRVRRKMPSNLPACRSAGVDFLPIAVKTLVGWCPDAITTICSIGQALGQQLNSTDPATPPNTSLAVWLLLCGGTMLPFGCTVNRHSPLLWMVYFNLLIVLFIYLFIVDTGIYKYRLFLLYKLLLLYSCKLEKQTKKQRIYCVSMRKHTPVV